MNFIYAGYSFYHFFLFMKAVPMSSHDLWVLKGNNKFGATDNILLYLSENIAFHVITFLCRIFRFSLGKVKQSYFCGKHKNWLNFKEKLIIKDILDSWLVQDVYVYCIQGQYIGVLSRLIINLDTFIGLNYWISLDTFIL